MGSTKDKNQGKYVTEVVEEEVEGTKVEIELESRQPYHRPLKLPCLNLIINLVVYDLV